jgi:pSer/pThr/pTyr-binding forkhead associated (FHA) protein
MKGKHGMRMALALSLGVLAGLGLFLILLAPPASAQRGILAVRGYGADVTQFPTVTVFFQLVDLSTGLPADQPVRVASLQEDRQEIPSGDQALMPAPRGADIVILLDASQSIISPRSRGYTGKSRLEEAREFVGQVAGRKDSKSRMALIAPIGDTIDFIGPKTLTEDGGAVSNQLQVFEFPERPKGKEATPLFDLLSRAMQLLIQRPDALGRPGFVIVLSDGIDFLSDQQVTDVTQRALNHRIVVHAIQIGPAQGRGSERAMENLRRLAGQTGGKVFIYGRDPDALASFYESIPSWGQIWALSYRSRVRQGGTHEIRVRLDAGGQAMEAQESYAIHLAAPVVEIDWEGRAEGRGSIEDPIRASQTPSLPITIRIRREDQCANCQHLIRQVRIGENVARFEQTAEPRIEGGTWILEGVVDLSQTLGRTPNEVYPLKVDVEDTLGLVSTGEGLWIRPRVAPAPAGRGILDLLPVVSCVVALMALAVAAVAFTRVPRLREAAVSMTQPIVQRIKEVTEPFFPSGAARGGEPARAWLVVVEGDAERRTIPIRSTHVRLGRDETLVNIVFNDRSVSRLHCRIEEVEEGVFYIYDEGSTSGTYVNYEQVPINGARLQDGDLINLGRVQLHFRLRLDQQEIRPEVQPTRPSPGPVSSKPPGEETEPFSEADDRTRVFHEPDQ